MNRIRLNIIFTIVFFITLCAIFPSNLHAAEEKKSSKGVDVSTLIFEHITDAYEWHIATIGTKHISIPLPVILWHNGSLSIFSSSHLHHGHSSYKGFKIIEEGAFKGKIGCVLINAAGQEEFTEKRPLDFSISKNVVSLFIGCIIIFLIFMGVAKGYKRNKDHAPKGLQSMLEPVILFVRDEVIVPAMGKKHSDRYLPYLLTLFFFILINNLLGIVPFFPGGANLTGNIAVTGILAVFTFIITLFSSKKHYWIDIINMPGVPWWLKIPLPIMPIVEILGMITKPFVLMVRLFANITAGHIIILGFMCLIFIFGNMSPTTGYLVSPVSVLFGVFMSLLELLVAFIQALVFTLLSALYIGMAIGEEHTEHNKLEIKH